MSAFIDARTIPSGTVLQPDLAIIGGGPAGISLALALAHTPLKIMLFESGGMDFDVKTQSLYAGKVSGISYLPLDASRMRYLGGSSNHWGGWCRPLDPIDFERARLGAAFGLAVRHQGTRALLQARAGAGRGRTVELRRLHQSP